MQINKMLIGIILLFLILNFSIRFYKSIILPSKHRDEFNERQREIAYKTKNWELILDTIDILSKTDPRSGVQYAFSIIERNKIYTLDQLQSLLYYCGEVYYDKGQTDSALKIFQIAKAGNRSSSPRDMINLAACYVRKKDYAKAFSLIEEAAKLNSEMIWYLGNIAEIQNHKEEAIHLYDSLYRMNNTCYSYCNSRIEELNQAKAKLFTELSIRNLKMRPMLLEMNYIVYPIITQESK